MGLAALARCTTQWHFSTLTLFRIMLISSQWGSGCGWTQHMVPKIGVFHPTNAHWPIYERTGCLIIIFHVCVLTFVFPASLLIWFVCKVRVRSEHAVGYLKGRMQSLRGLRQDINSESDLFLALSWVRVCIIIHSLAMQHEVIPNTFDSWVELGLHDYEYDNVPAEDSFRPGDTIQANHRESQGALKR
jgi:hypothetical protein